MDRQNLSAYYAANVGLVHKLTQKGHARLMAIGAPLAYEDLFQELSEVFIHAFDKYDEGHVNEEGEKTKFSSYYSYAATNKLNKIAKEYELERFGTVSKVVKTGKGKDAKIVREMNKYGQLVPKMNVSRYHFGTNSIHDTGSISGDERDMYEIVPCPSATPEEVTIANDLMAKATNKLSPMAKKIVDILADPPPFIERELEAAIAHGAHARSKNIQKRVRQQLDIGLVCAVIEKATHVPHATVASARRELESVFGRLTNG